MAVPGLLAAKGGEKSPGRGLPRRAGPCYPVPAMFRKTVVQNLLLIVGAYQKATGRSLSTISKQFYGRGDFLEKLKAGEHSISIDRLSALIEQLRAEWPDNAIWPMTRPVFMTRAPKK